MRTHRIGYGLMTALTCSLFASTLTPLAQTAGAPNSKPKVDARAETALKKTGFHYTVTPLGNFSVPLAMKEERHQEVFISSYTDTFDDMETRRLWSTVWRSPEAPSTEMLSKLLMDNVPQKLGAFELAKTETGYKIMYAAKIDAHAPPAVLRAAIRLVMYAADNKEKELTGKDEY